MITPLPPRKLFKPLGDDNYLFEIDNTSLEGFLACDRAAFFNLVLGRTGIKGAAITYGKAIHKALELHYKDQANLPTQLQAGNEILSTLPYNPSEWRGPESFQKAVEIERRLQKNSENTILKGKPFLHSSCVPLDQVEFKNEKGHQQIDLFKNECEGLCGV